ncbi:MAG: deoxyribodipyrimidine photo-lyase, partial [Pseudomonadota bacterium]
MFDSPLLYWLREDLRFDDNPALRAAANSGQPVLCLYILEAFEADKAQMGGAQRWWLHHSLTAFQEDLEKRGGKLILRKGDAKKIVPQIVKDVNASKVVWNRRYATWQIDVDKTIKEKLTKDDIEVESFNGRLLYEPWEIYTKSDKPYRVYTPYWKSVQAREDMRDTLPRVDKLISPSSLPKTDQLEDWNLPPQNPNWAEDFSNHWTPGEAGARKRWRSWLNKEGDQYKDQRNIPSTDGTSRLSPHLHFGEISPVTLWHDVKDAISAGDVPEEQGKVYLSEIVWREFSYQLLFHHPQMTEEPLMEKFAAFEWDNDKDYLKAWQRGQTGYPIVDAGMRQLWQTGWMHNRVRMIVGSFLVKDLFIDWQHGMAWFQDTLVDADFASNTASWQWIAGCGADAAPFFRIFNPTTQGEKFDPDGDYVRQFVPELAKLHKKYIHAPEKAPQDVLEEAELELGKDYPHPIVDHGKA